MSDIQGMTKLIKKLQDLPLKDGKKAIRKGTRKGAKEMLPTAKTIAPAITGALRNDLKVRALPRSRKYFGATIRCASTDGKTYYGSFVNYGTKYQRAQKFLNSAAKQNRRQAIDTSMKEIAKEIERTTKLA